MIGPWLAWSRVDGELQCALERGQGRLGGAGLVLDPPEGTQASELVYHRSLEPLAPRGGMRCHAASFLVASQLVPDDPCEPDRGAGDCVFVSDGLRGMQRFA